MKHTEKLLPILLHTHAVLCGQDIDECERAFAALCKENLEAGIHLADLLVIALPHTEPLWKAIIIQEKQNRTDGYKSTDIDRQSGLAMSKDDTLDTARGLADHMGWRDVEAGRA